jgi:nucleoside-diphosphate-sugar epimerase
VLVRASSNRNVIDLPGVTFVDGDVNDDRAIRQGMEGCSSVIHMAAVVGSNLPEEEWWRINRDGTRKVLQAACDRHLNMVQVSTISVFGPTEPGEIADETKKIDTNKYISLYQKTKHAADELAREFAAKGLAVKIVYPAFGYGCSAASSHPSMQDQTLLRMAAGQPTAIMGSGRNRLCLSYYRDTATGIQLALKNGNAGDDYLLGNENLTFIEIWKAVAGVLGKEPPRRRIPLPLLKTIAAFSRLITGKSVIPPDLFDMFGFNWCFSSRKAVEKLGWQPHTFLDGIKETWQEYQKQGWKA